MAGPTFADDDIESINLKCSSERFVQITPEWSEHPAREMFLVEVKLYPQNSDAITVLLDHGFTEDIRPEDGPFLNYYNWYTGKYTENKIKTGQSFKSPVNKEGGTLILRRAFELNRNTGEFKFTTSYEPLSKIYPSFYIEGFCELFKKAF
jgi:hypothetical protein